MKATKFKLVTDRRGNYFDGYAGRWFDGFDETIIFSPTLEGLKRKWKTVTGVELITPLSKGVRLRCSMQARKKHK